MKKTRSRPLNHEQQRISKWLQEVRFKKAFFGGVERSGCMEENRGTQLYV